MDHRAGLVVYPDMQVIYRAGRERGGGGGGGAVLPYEGYIGLCRGIGYGFLGSWSLRRGYT